MIRLCFLKSYRSCCKRVSSNKLQLEQNQPTQPRLWPALEQNSSHDVLPIDLLRQKVNIAIAHLIALSLAQPKLYECLP